MSKERSVKEQARALQGELSRLTGGAVKLSTAQEMIARVYGYGNWNTMAAMRAQAELAVDTALPEERLTIVAYADGAYLETREDVTLREFRDWAQGVLDSGLPYVKVEGLRVLARVQTAEVVATVTRADQAIPYVGGLDTVMAKNRWAIAVLSDRFAEVPEAAAAAYPQLCREVEDAEGELTELGRSLEELMRMESTYFAYKDGQWGICWQIAYSPDYDDPNRPFGTLETREYCQGLAAKGGAELSEYLKADELREGVSMLATFGPHTWNMDASLWVFVPVKHIHAARVQDCIENWRACW